MTLAHRLRHTLSRGTLSNVRNEGVQTKRQSGSSVPKPSVYMAGLRGQPNPTFPPQRVDLTLSVHTHNNMLHHSYNMLQPTGVLLIIAYCGDVISVLGVGLGEFPQQRPLFFNNSRSHALHSKVDADSLCPASLITSESYRPQFPLACNGDPIHTRR